MAGPQLGLVDDTRLQAIELAAAPLSAAEPRVEPTDPRVRRYLEDLPPGTVLELIAEVRRLRLALEGASAALAAAGFTPEAYRALDDAERESPLWRAARQVWEAGVAEPAGGAYVLRYSGGAARGARSFPTAEAALAAAIEALEMSDGYPEAIEADGVCVMDCGAILRAWEERHDPG